MARGTKRKRRPNRGVRLTRIEAAYLLGVQNKSLSYGRGDGRRGIRSWMELFGVPFAMCRICDRLTGIHDATIDHVVPWAQGGSNALHNFRVACTACNQGRHKKR